MRLDVAGSTSASDATWAGAIETSYTADYVANPCATGIRMAAFSQVGGPEGNRYIYSLSVPALGISRTKAAATTKTAMDCVVRLEDVQLITLSSGVWRLKASALIWEVEGVTEYTHGAIELTSGMFPCPSAIPLIGIHPIMDAGADLLLIPAIGCSEATTIGNVTSTVEGGWRFKPVGGAWEVLPVNVDAGTLLAGPTTGSVSGSDTWNCQATAFHDITAGDQAEGQAWIMIVPELDRTVQRIGVAEYAALVARGGLPGVPIVRFTSTQVLACDLEEISFTSSTDEVGGFAEYSEYLDVVDGSPSIIEGPLTDEVFCPFRVQGTLIEPGGSTITFTGRSQELGPTQYDSDVVPGLTHPDWKAQFQNTWCCPHWSYALWFPPDSATGSLAWDADYGPAPSTEYWYPNRQQELSHPALPEERNRQGQRNSVILDLLNQNGLAGVVNALFGGDIYSWWGLCSFDARPWSDTDAADMTAELKDPDLWTGATLSGSTATITGGEPDLKVATVQIGDWSNPPYRTAEAMRRITIAAPTGCTLWKVELVGSDGALAVLANQSSGAGTYAIPWNPGIKGAGSWIQEFGQPYMSDLGVDVAAGMNSSVTFGDAATLGALGLLPTRTAKALKITCVRDSGAITWAAPTLTRSALVTHTVRAERSSVAAIIDEAIYLETAGPLSRWGDQSCWDYLYDSPANPPIPRGVPYASTVYDLLNLEALRLRGEPFGTDFSVRAGLLYQVGLEWVQEAHLARDPDMQLTTLACWLPGASGPVGIAINTFRATPPLSTFPHRDRTTDFKPDAGSDFGLKVWTACEARHFHFLPKSTGEQIRVWPASPDVTDQLTGDASIAGWSIRYHKRAHTGSESNVFRVGSGALTIQRGRPYRGGTFVLPAGDREPSLMRSNVDQIHLATINTGGQLMYRRAAGAGPFGGWESEVMVSAETDCRWPCQAQDHRGRVELLFQRTNTPKGVYQTFSDDEGATWSAPTLYMANATMPKVRTDAERLLKVRAWFAYDSGTSGPGTIKLRQQYAGDPAESATFTLQISVVGVLTDLGVDDSGFDLYYSGTGAGRWMLSCAPVSGGLKHYQSHDDCKTWTEIV